MVDIFNWFIRKCICLIISLISFGIIKCLIFRYIKCFFVNVWAHLFHLLSFHLDVSSCTSWKIAVLKFTAFSFFISLSVIFSFLLLIHKSACLRLLSISHWYWYWYIYFIYILSIFKIGSKLEIKFSR